MKELEDMFEALAQSSAEARASGSKDKAAPSPSLTDDDISTDGEGTSYETDISRMIGVGRIRESTGGTRGQ